MTSEEALLEQIKVLPPDLKKEVSDFVEFLQTKVKKESPRVSLEGIWADMDVNISEEDISEARKEMFANFPREEFFENGENK
jgi:hypothetical protein